MLELHELRPERIPLLREWLDRFPRRNCDYSICNLMSWGKIYGNRYAIWRDHLVLVNPKYGYVFYPVGPGLKSAALRELIELYRNQAGPPSTASIAGADRHPQATCVAGLETAPARPREAELILIPEDWERSNPDLGEYFQICDERDWADYVHSVERLAELRGRKLAKKKNLVSQFGRTYPEYHTVPITPDKGPELLSFTERWRRERNVEGIYLNTEFQAIRNTLEDWDKLPVEGIIICHRHSISAYSIFSRQTADMATVHFEKFDPDMKGSAQTINWETAMALRGRYLWVNREQDMGLEGLRQAKLSYDPDLLARFLIGKPL